MASYTLTIREGPRVARSKHETLEQAVAELGRRARELRAEGRLPAVSMLRDFSPGERVKARLEISTGGLFRRREAGVDLMGDGSLVAYRGGIFRKPLDEAGPDDLEDAIAAALRE